MALPGLRALSVLVDRLRLAGFLGKQFGGKRNLYEVYGYPILISSEDMQAKYIRQDIAARIVSLPAEATWFPPPEVQGSNEFNTRWEEIVNEFPVWNTIYRADKLCALGSFSGIVIGTDGNGSLAYLRAFSSRSLNISQWDRNPRSPRFGLPQTYTVMSVDPQGTGTAIPGSANAQRGLRAELSWEQVVHIVEDKLENDVYGVPRLQLVYNLLEDLMKVVGGSAETFWLLANRGMQADVDKDTVLSEEDAKALNDELEEYMHQLRRVIRTRGVNIKALGSDVPNPKGVFDVIMTLISGATGIPKRILLGSEAGQLASTEDRVQWAARIKERRQKFAGPEVLIPFVKRLQMLGILPEGDFTVRWSDPTALTPLEAAQTMAQKARAAINLSKQLDLGEAALLTKDEARSILGFEAEGS